ncbi:hypothetical protein GXP67_23430 [Rhodocytophaga rosea]|uniref:Carboxypeptidase-like regulatory domain-containing protein n=1 Tax=Rhodocytophaga rosea TaxID=2704465 RepID=A0A6C0GP27_9BACT|nr:carboxypeptidase-like regulatory domain-containing protein [Rhodocytophaga rosea]QHT69380.1 hypothetical protein GXP67_23430 [Rhodocytophaga rosea]
MKLLFSTILYLGIIDGFSQQITVSGKIIDKDLQSIAGAVIQTLNAEFKTATNENGEFTFSIPEESQELEVHYAGMFIKRELIKGNCPLHVVLLPMIYYRSPLLEEEQKKVEQDRELQAKKIKIKAYKKRIFKRLESQCL